MPTVQLKETSFHLAFLCLLHLAHEKNLILTQENTESMLDHSALFMDSDILIQNEQEFAQDPTTANQSSEFRRPHRRLREHVGRVIEED